MGGFFSVSSWNDVDTSYVDTPEAETTDLSGAAVATDVSGASTDVSGASTDVSGAAVATDVSGAAVTTDVSDASTDVSGATPPASTATSDPAPPSTKGGGEELTADDVQAAQDDLERTRQQAEYATQIADIKKKQAQAELEKSKAEKESEQAQVEVANNETSTPIPQTAGTRGARTKARRRTYKKRARKQSAQGEETPK